MVIWEANPYPFVHFSGPKGLNLYRAEAIHRAFAAQLRLYLQKAGIDVPTELDAIISLDKAVYEPAMSALKAV